MKKAILSVVLMLIFLVSLLLLTGCGKNSNNDNKNPLIGSWDHSGYVYTFNEDKTGSYKAFGSEMNFTYEDDGSKVIILYKGNTTSSSYEYKIDGKKLIIKDSFGKDVVYEKK